jgi:hypothetical protein
MNMGGREREEKGGRGRRREGEGGEGRERETQHPSFSRSCEFYTMLVPRYMIPHTDVCSEEGSMLHATIALRFSTSMRTVTSRAVPLKLIAFTNRATFTLV